MDKDRDIIIIVSNCDCTYATVNGKEVGSGIERGYELMDILPYIFDNLEHSYNKPLIYEVYEEDYFDNDERGDFWDREYKHSNTDEMLFLEDEIKVLIETGDVDLFVDKIKQNLREEK